MTWLDEIEDEANLALEGDEDIGEYMDKLRMARVIRMQSAVLKKTNPWTFVTSMIGPDRYDCGYCRASVSYYKAPEGIESWEFMEAHETNCAWSNLPPDAKELLE